MLYGNVKNEQLPLVFRFLDFVFDTCSCIFGVGSGINIKAKHFDHEPLGLHDKSKDKQWKSPLKEEKEWKNQFKEEIEWKNKLKEEKEWKEQ